MSLCRKGIWILLVLLPYFSVLSIVALGVATCSMWSSESEFPVTIAFEVLWALMGVGTTRDLRTVCSLPSLKYRTKLTRWVETALWNPRQHSPRLLHFLLLPPLFAHSRNSGTRIGRTCETSR
jgi:hypothetical protein